MDGGQEDMRAVTSYEPASGRLSGRRSAGRRVQSPTILSRPLHLGGVPHTHVISDNGFWRLVISKPGQAARTADMGLARSRKK
jgi:hypothetical protein